jgi:DNA-binding transcriptional MerR regulator
VRDGEDDQFVPEAWLGIEAVAQQLGISASTLRSWEYRYGLARPQAAPGRHRRYSAADLARLTAMRELIRNGMPAAQAAALVTAGPATRPQLAALAGRLRAAADVMNGGYIAAIVQAALLRYGTVLAWKEIISPVLIEAGTRWQQHGDGVAREHLLSGTTDAVLRAHAHYTLEPDPAGPAVLLLAAPGERHTLPLSALAAALAERGTAAVSLAELPAIDLRNTLARLQPRKAVLWARSRETARLATLGSLMQEGRRVYAAGPGWNAATLPPGVRHVATLAAALRALGPGARRQAR